MWKHIKIKPVLRTTLIVPLLATAMLFFSGAAQASCVKWSNARGIIKKNNLQKPGDVRKRAIRRGNEVIHINLCRRGGRYVYRLTVIGKNKRVREYVVDARNGKKVRRRSKGKLKTRILNKVRSNLRRHGINPRF